MQTWREGWRNKASVIGSLAKVMGGRNVCMEA